MAHPTRLLRPLHLRPLHRIALAAALALAATGSALAAPPSDADINRLLAASRAQSLIEGMLPQLETMQQQQFAQLAEQHQLDDQARNRLQRIQERSSTTMRQALSWQEMRPMYVQLYKQTFTREDVVAMAEFYESSAGQSLLDKTPALMQNVMVAVQQKMVPLMEQLRKDIEEIANETPAGHEGH